MPYFKRHDKDLEKWETTCASVKNRFIFLFIAVGGPLFLMFLNIRCIKNQCVILQFPLVVPTHLSAYYSSWSFVIFASFLLYMLLINKLSKHEVKKGRAKDNTNVYPALTGMSSLSIIMLIIAYLKPEVILFVRAEYLKLLTITMMFCFAFASVLTLLNKIRYIRKDRDACTPIGFFLGFNYKIKLFGINLKYFFYVSGGLVAWALVDLLIFTSHVVEHPITAPLLFVFTTQYVLIVHTLLFEKFMINRPFMESEGLGFFWLMRVLLYTPFFFSLPVLYTSATRVTMPKPAMLANCGLFMFGFVIYVSALHQKESFASYPLGYRNLKSVVATSGKRLLAGGYWGTVQKPDYLGYMIMWLSWVVACGFSSMSVLVLFMVYAIVIFWLNQRTVYHRERYGNAWIRYTTHVPHKLVPFVY